MDIFDLLTMLGGLSLFLFGMSVMGQALEGRGDSCALCWAGSPEAPRRGFSPGWG